MSDPGVAAIVEFINKVVGNDTEAVMELSGNMEVAFSVWQFLPHILEYIPGFDESHLSTLLYGLKKSLFSPSDIIFTTEQKVEIKNILLELPKQFPTIFLNNSVNFLIARFFVHLVVSNAMSNEEFHQLYLDNSNSPYTKFQLRLSIVYFQEIQKGQISSYINFYIKTLLQALHIKSNDPNLALQIKKEILISLHQSFNYMNNKDMVRALYLQRIIPYLLSQESSDELWYAFWNNAHCFDSFDEILCEYAIEYMGQEESVQLRPFAPIIEYINFIAKYNECGGTEIFSLDSLESSDIQTILKAVPIAYEQDNGIEINNILDQLTLNNFDSMKDLINSYKDFIESESSEGSESDLFILLSALQSVIKLGNLDFFNAYENPIQIFWEIIKIKFDQIFADEYFSKLAHSIIYEMVPFFDKIDITEFGEFVQNILQTQHSINNYTCICYLTKSHSFDILQSILNDDNFPGEDGLEYYFSILIECIHNIPIDENIIQQLLSFIDNLGEYPYLAFRIISEILMNAPFSLNYGVGEKFLEIHQYFLENITGIYNDQESNFNIESIDEYSKILSKVNMQFPELLSDQIPTIKEVFSNLYQLDVNQFCRELYYSTLRIVFNILDEEDLTELIQCNRSFLNDPVNFYYLQGMDISYLGQNLTTQAASTLEDIDNDCNVFIGGIMELYFNVYVPDNIHPIFPQVLEAMGKIFNQIMEETNPISTRSLAYACVLVGFITRNGIDIPEMYRDNLQDFISHYLIIDGTLSDPYVSIAAIAGFSPEIEVPYSDETKWVFARNCVNHPDQINIDQEIFVEINNNVSEDLSSAIIFITLIANGSIEINENTIEEIRSKIRAIIDAHKFPRIGLQLFLEALIFLFSQVDDVTIRSYIAFEMGLMKLMGRRVMVYDVCQHDIDVYFQTVSGYLQNTSEMFEESSYGYEFQALLESIPTEPAQDEAE